MTDLKFEEPLIVDDGDNEEEKFNLYEALTLYRDLTMEMSIYTNRLKELKEQITEHVKDTGEVAAINGARIQITQGYTRRVVDTKPFIEWCEAHPRSKASEFLYDKEYAPGVRIRVGL